ncbi:MAG: hypothetical protein RIF32_09940 [Leptospirales bacterium]
MHNLRELKGQAIASRMMTAYLQAHPPPLMILHGPDGTGKWSAAEAFIQQSMCEVGTGCGSCPACRKILRGEHPDFIRFPEDRTYIGETTDPAEFTVRWLLNTRLCYTPFDGHIRYVLFPRADLIQHEAETALLKTLEEPPEHTRFIFLVRNLDDLKQTVVSRGVAIPFRLLPEAAMKELGGELNDAELRLLGGSLHLAPFLRTELYRKMSEMIRNGLEHPQALVQLEKWIHQGERSRFADSLPADEGFEFLELLDIFGLLLLENLAGHPLRQTLAPVVFEFKAQLHREMSGLHQYLLGRLFQKLDRILFRREKAG